jgi:hypothetical protein
VATCPAPHRVTVAPQTASSAVLLGLAAAAPRGGAELDHAGLSSHRHPTSGIPTHLPVPIEGGAELSPAGPSPPSSTRRTGPPLFRRRRRRRRPSGSPTERPMAPPWRPVHCAAAPCPLRCCRLAAQRHPACFTVVRRPLPGRPVGRVSAGSAAPWCALVRGSRKGVRAGGRAGTGGWDWGWRLGARRGARTEWSVAALRLVAGR